MANISGKTRISTFYNWLVPILSLISVICLSAIYIIRLIEKPSILNVIAVLIIIGLWASLYFGNLNKIRTVFIDDNAIYIGRFFSFERVEFANIEVFKPKDDFAEPSKMHIVKYVKDDLKVVGVEFYARSSKSEAVSMIREKINEF